MLNIRVLPPDVVNRIAAGEVVERPASVAKELIENALDANATEVAVHLEEGGKKRIQVRDNGCGIAPDDFELVFHSHATSKLKDEELASNSLGMSSLGFRGEALPSIASVSKLLIESKANKSNGMQIEVEHGKVNAIIPSSISDGTRITVSITGTSGGKVSSTGS